MAAAVSRRSVVVSPVPIFRTAARPSTGTRRHWPFWFHSLVLDVGRHLIVHGVLHSWGGYRVNRPAATSAIVARSGSGRARALGAHAR